LVEETASFAEVVLYPLWDAGFAVGHALRTPEECVAAAREHLESLTAQLDFRFLAGDSELFRAAKHGVLDIGRADPEGLASRLGRAAAARRERYGSCSYLLEPELKEGGGGLRDLASLGWLERALGSTLEERGFLTPRERQAIAAAEEFLTRVRGALHIESGKRSDRLVLEYQPPVARSIGFLDEPDLLAEDGLMRALFEHARTVDSLTEEILIEGGRRMVPDRASPPEDAADVVRLFLDGDDSRIPTPAELDVAQSLDLPEEIRWTDEVRDAFLAVLATSESARALAILDRIGMLGRLLPEWRSVRCRPQRDPYHRYTVDIHLLRTLEETSRSLREGAGDHVVAEAARRVSDPQGLLLGALFHDIGKVGRRDHVRIGIEVATRALDRMGIEDRSRDLALFLVTNHLLLSDTATRRDLTDDDLVLDVAAKIGSPERLAALYLLSAADGRATGPAASTEWRATLGRELVTKVERVFEHGEMGQEVADRLRTRTDRLRELLAGERLQDVDRFVLRMPRSYFLAVDAGRAARHFPLVAPFLGAREVRTASWKGSRAGTYELLVVTADRPGLLSWIAGSLAVEGLSILTAHVFTTDDGVAVDLFEVEGLFDPDVREESWRRLRSLLRKAVDARVSIEHLVEQKRRHYPVPKRPVPVTVAIDNDASDFFTVVEVGAADRIGLLFDITRTLSELHLDVHLAKIATYADRVIDAFYVRDELGQKVLDDRHVGEISSEIRTRLAAG
jgi:[protein-PII] uridylyltransferase